MRYLHLSGIYIEDKLLLDIHKQSGEYVTRAYAKWVNGRVYNTEKSSALDTTNVKFRLLLQTDVSPSGIELKKGKQTKRKTTLSRMTKQVNAGHLGNRITNKKILPSRIYLSSTDDNSTTTEISRPTKKVRRTDDDFKLLYNGIQNSAMGRLQSKGVANIPKQLCCSILWIGCNTVKRDTQILAKEAKNDLKTLMDSAPN